MSAITGDTTLLVKYIKTVKVVVISYSNYLKLGNYTCVILNSRTVEISLIVPFYKIIFCLFWGFLSKGIVFKNTTIVYKIKIWEKYWSICRT